MKKIFFLIFTSSVIFIFLIFFSIFKFYDQKLHLIFCDVGQGDAIYIRTKSGADILIDGGPDSTVLSCLSENMPIWDRKIDIVIMTHPDSDHGTGLIEVLRRYKVENFYRESDINNSDLSKLIEAILAEKKMSAKFLSSGEILNDGKGLKIQVLWPASEEIKRIGHNNSNKSLNEVSIVLLVIYGEFSALLTADVDSHVMDKIASNVPQLYILKVPHHGSSTGLSEGFVKKTKPEYAVVSAGLDNSYGHPAKNILEILKKHRVTVKRTDIDGNIKIFTDGDEIEVRN